jgi:hypothetical protein
MKKLLPILLATITLLANAQIIRRVNNNPGVTGLNVYTTAQAAHDAAAANDIVIVEPSVSSYGDLILTKPLKIYGNGYFLSTNTELKADQRTSMLRTVSFNTGSGGSFVAGLEITGFNILDPILNQSSSLTIFGVSNIEIQRCKLSYPLYIMNYNMGKTANSNVTSIVIRSNYLQNGMTLPNTPIDGYTVSNVIVQNNLFITGGLGGHGSSAQGWIVQNNTFVSSYASLQNSVFDSNLLVVGGTGSYTNVTFSFNVSSTASFPDGIGNQNNVTVSNELIGTGADISDDERYQIKAGSPLKTAGNGGTEVGAYGGATPYVVSGIPAIPSIINMTNTATGSNTVPLQVTISVKGNN